MSNARVGIRRNEQEERNRLLFNELDDDQLTTVLLALRIARDSSLSVTKKISQVAFYPTDCRFAVDCTGSYQHRAINCNFALRNAKKSSGNDI